jgi:hypothetical protein
VDLLLIACGNALLEARGFSAAPPEVVPAGLGGLGVAAVIVALRGRDLHPTNRYLILVLGGCVGMLVGVPLGS